MYAEKRKIVMIPSLSSLVAPQVAMTTCGATGDYKVGIMTTPGFQSITNPRAVPILHHPIYIYICMYLYNISAIKVVSIPIEDFTPPTLEQIDMFIKVMDVARKEKKVQDRIGEIIRADSRFAPSQWETALQSNAVSHWLSTHLESALNDSKCQSAGQKYFGKKVT